MKWSKLTGGTEESLYKEFPGYEFHDGTDGDFYTATPQELMDILDSKQEDCSYEPLSSLLVNEFSLDQDTSEEVLKELKYRLGAYFGQKKRKEIYDALGFPSTVASTGLQFPIIGNTISNDVESILRQAMGWIRKM